MKGRNDYLEYRRYWEGEQYFRPEGCLEYLATYLSVFVRDQIQKNPNEHVSLQPAAILKALEAFPKTDGSCHSASQTTQSLLSTIRQGLRGR